MVIGRVIPMPNSIPQPNNPVKSNGLKVVFLGTPEFAAPILEKLASSSPPHQNWCGGRYKPIAVFCAPDKPVGRKQVLTHPPVKILAQKYNIPVFQPANSRELIYTLKSIPHTLIITVAYGLILPREVLKTPKFGCLNIHPSLLPKYRGPSPIQAAILAGDTETGVTIYKMDEQIDHGPILITNHLSLITQKFTTPELSKILAELGADLLLKILPDYLAGKIAPQPQDETQAICAKIITKQDGRIDWQKSAAEIERQIRAYDPWPGSFTKFNGQKLKIIKATLGKAKTNKQIYPEQKRGVGKIFLTETGELAVQCGQGYLITKTLQLEGGKLLPANNFLRGHQDIIGQILN